MQYFENFGKDGFMKEKILVINDDDGIRAITKLPLVQQGYEVFEANNGKMGLEQSMRVNPDLILLDVMMPEMDGYETCVHLKQNPNTKEIPVIFLSSLTDAKDKIKGLEIGGVDFVNNVVDRGELLARVQNQLKIRSLTRALMDSNQKLLLKQESLDNDLRAAAIIQKSFLPHADVQLPNIDISWAWTPSNPLGGDIFNVIQYNPETVIAYMIDVSGHDVPSALVTVSVSQFLNQLNRNSNALLTPQEIMIALDKEYPMERFDRYFTIFYSVLNTSSGNLYYSRAGHLPGIKLSKKKDFQLLEEGGPLVGLNLNLPFEQGSTDLEPGDKIILYTDGITDVKNKQGEFYGAERFYSLLETNKTMPIEKIIQLVKQSINQFSDGLHPVDDISLMGFEFKGKK